MLIVDAQIHLWNAGNPTSPWHRQIPAYLKQDALKEMDAGGVDAAILTPHTPWDPNANELCIEAARAHPDRFAILGNFALDKPESRALVDTWKQRPGMLGCRFTFIGPDQSKWPTDGTVDWLWPAAERAGLPIAMMFLAQSKLPGLEVRTAEGDWIRPPAVPGTFVVNTGAMLARYSNDRFRATPHRVINRNDRSRYACPFFLGPNHDVVVAPVPSCVGPDNPPNYEPTTYGAFTQHLLTLNFAHRQAGGSGEYAG